MPLSPGVMLVDQPIYNIFDSFTIVVPGPGTGGGVGRQKIAENSSPIPRFEPVPLEPDQILTLGNVDLTVARLDEP